MVYVLMVKNTHRGIVTVPCLIMASFFCIASFFFEMLVKCLVISVKNMRIPVICTCNNM